MTTKRELRLPDELAARLEATAKRRGLSQNALVILALEAYLSDTPPVAPPPPPAPSPAEPDVLDFD